MKKIILLSAICAAFTCCHKESPKETLPYIEVPADVWNYIRLTAGSWYIYKDSATGLTDSVNVTASSVSYKVYKSLTGIGTQDGYYYDDYTLTLESVDLSGNKTEWLSALSSSVIWYVSSVSSYWRLTDPARNITLMEYPSNLPGSATNYKISSASVYGNTYSDIHVVKGSLGSGSGPAEVWWVKDIGIVKLTRKVGSEVKTALLLRKK